MTVETATKISQLNPLGPPGSDPKSEGDNHLRLIKSTLQAVFDDSGTTIKTTLPIGINGRLVLSPADMALVGHTGTPDFVAFNSKADGTGADIATVDKAGKLTIASDLAVTGNAAVTGKATVTGDLTTSGTVLALHGIPDYISGLTMVANSATTIDILPGEAKGNGKVVFSAATMTKRLDALWAIGSGNGGLDVGAKAASKTYFAIAIRRQSDGLFDWLYSLSPTAPTLPSGWDMVKMLLPLLTDASGNIRTMYQRGDQFTYGTLVSDRSSTAAQASTLITLTVPQGVMVRPIMNINLATGASASTVGLGDAANGSTQASVLNLSASSGIVIPIPPLFATNLLAQLYFSLSAAASAFGLNTFGFVHECGRIP